MVLLFDLHVYHDSTQQTSDAADAVIALRAALGECFHVLEIIND